MHSIRPVRVAARAMLAIVAFSVSAGAASAQALPTAKSLLEKHDAAVGGRAAMDKHSSRHETVSLSIPAANISGTMETWNSKPNLYLSKQSFAGGEVATGFNGTTAWLVAPGQGASVLDTAAAAEMKAQSDFFGDYYDPSRVKSAETVGITDFQGQRCYQVKIVHKDNTESMIFLDSATGLRAGQTEVAKMNGQEMQRTVVMTDYKDFGGVKIPTKRVMKLPMAEVVMEVTAVDFDKVDATTYALPPSVKALVKP
jgi:hypothetical protein